MAAEGDTPARQGPELLAFNAARPAAPDLAAAADSEIFRFESKCAKVGRPRAIVHYLAIQLDFPER